MHIITTDKKWNTHLFPSQWWAKGSSSLKSPKRLNLFYSESEQVNIVAIVEVHQMLDDSQKMIWVLDTDCLIMLVN